MLQIVLARRCNLVGHAPPPIGENCSFLSARLYHWRYCKIPYCDRGIQAENEARSRSKMGVGKGGERSYPPSHRQACPSYITLLETHVQNFRLTRGSPHRFRWMLRGPYGRKCNACGGEGPILGRQGGTTEASSCGPLSPGVFPTASSVTRS